MVKDTSMVTLWYLAKGKQSQSTVLSSELLWFIKSNLSQISNLNVDHEQN